MFHALYTDFMLNVGNVSAESKERMLYLMRVMGLNESLPIRNKRRSMLDGLEQLWKESRAIAGGTQASKDARKDLCISIPWRPAGMNALVPVMLGAPAVKYSIKPPELAGSALYCAFGTGRGSGNLSVEEAARQAKKSLMRFEYGFISSRGLALHDSVQHSLILCPEVMYYDARNVSPMERDLSSDDFSLTAGEKARADRLIREITTRKLTKYNHAPDIDPGKLIPLSKRKKILLVDQRFGDASIGMGLASQNSFQQMWDEALKHEDHDIIVKLHPDAVSGGKDSCFSKLLPKKLPKNVYVLKDDINPYNILSVVDKVFVCVSQLGFEALMIGKEVHCFGVSFYSGWGLTVDHIAPLRARRKRTLQEVFHVFYVEYSRYATGDRPCELEDLIEYLSSHKTAQSAALTNALSSTTAAAPVSASQSVSGRPGHAALKVLFVIPSGRFGATGRYFHVLALEMRKLGAEVMVLAEAHETKAYEGITWLKLEFDGMRLSKGLRQRIGEFAPDVVYENGVRTRAQRAALEILYLTNAKLALQSEDDDIQVYMTRHPSANDELIRVLDKPKLSHTEILKFLKLNDWAHTVKVLLNPDFDRWVDPLLRALCYHCASLNTAIWYPFERRLKEEYAVPTMVVPPVADVRELTAQRLQPYRETVLEKVEPGNITLFLGGTIYDYSPEFEIFLRSLNLLCEQQDSYAITLIVVSGRTNLNVGQMARDVLDQRIQFIDLGAPDDKEYMRHLVLADVICSPGLPDRFNLYRLPSRLVKAMHIGKAVLTTKIGFGESLTHAENAILIDGENPAEWASSMSMVFDRQAIKRIGDQGKAFAEKHFDARLVAGDLLNQFRKII
jgi:capsular polysaccharide export protein